MPVVKQHGTEEPRETPNIAFASPTNFIKPKVILSCNFEVLLNVRKNRVGILLGTAKEKLKETMEQFESWEQLQLVTPKRLSEGP